MQLTGKKIGRRLLPNGPRSEEGHQGLRVRFLLKKRGPNSGSRGQIRMRARGQFHQRRRVHILPRGGLSKTTPLRPWPAQLPQDDCY